MVIDLVHAHHLQPHGELVNALRPFTRPESPDRYARKYTAEHGPEGIADDYSHNAIVANLERLDGKHASVLKKH